MCNPSSCTTCFSALSRSLARSFPRQPASSLLCCCCRVAARAHTQRVPRRVGRALYEGLFILRNLTPVSCQKSTVSTRAAAATNNISLLPFLVRGVFRFYHTHSSLFAEIASFGRGANQRRGRRWWMGARVYCCVTRGMHVRLISHLMPAALRVPQFKIAKQKQRKLTLLGDQRKNQPLACTLFSSPSGRRGAGWYWVMMITQKL